MSHVFSTSVSQSSSSKRRCDPQEVIEELENISHFCENEILKLKRENFGRGVRPIQKIKAQIHQIIKMVPKIAKKRNITKPLGLNKQFQIDPKLASFLQIPDHRMISRSETINAFCVYIHLKFEESREKMLRWKHLNEVDRDLRNPTNRREIILDKTLISLWNLSSEEEKIYYYSIPKLINPFFISSKTQA